MVVVFGVLLLLMFDVKFKVVVLKSQQKMFEFSNDKIFSFFDMYVKEIVKKFVECVDGFFKGLWDKLWDVGKDVVEVQLMDVVRQLVVVEDGKFLLVDGQVKVDGEDKVEMLVDLL